MTSKKSENKEPTQPDNDDDVRVDPVSDEARDIKEKGEPDGGGNFA